MSAALPHEAEGRRVADNIKGMQEGERFIARLRAGPAEPDELERAILRAQRDGPDILRGLCRILQRELERGRA